jgi:predicted Fe-Mo cluster-binding NifX family protein
MTRAAFATWNERIAPVFDVAQEILVVQIESGQIVDEKLETLPEDLPVRKALHLAELGVETLVCGAISRPLLDMISGYGIHVFPFVVGDLREVMRTWLADGLHGDAFAMPGCPGWGRQRSAAGATGGRQRKRARGRGNLGSGSAQAHGWRRAGRRAGPQAAGPSGSCRCPLCGHQEAHERGMPCVQRTCPQCGTSLVRE